MKVNNIKLNDDEMPAEITVTLTMEEAAFVAVAMGAYTDRTVETAAPEFANKFPHHGVYYGLSNVFNQYWDDGIHDAVKEIGQQ